jgi:hypothetical protein
MSLTDREKERIEAMIDAGEPLPPKYRSVLSPRRRMVLSFVTMNSGPASTAHSMMPSSL